MSPDGVPSSPGIQSAWHGGDDDLSVSCTDCRSLLQVRMKEAEWENQENELHILEISDSGRLASGRCVQHQKKRKCLESSFSVAGGGSVRVLQTGIWDRLWGNPSPFVHFVSSTFGSSLAEPSTRGFELGVFLSEPGLPAGYSEFLIRPENPDKAGTDSGGICSTAEREGGAASILGLLQPDFPFFIVQDYEQPHQRSPGDRSLLSSSQNTNVPGSEAGGLRSRWTLK